MWKHCYVEESAPCTPPPSLEWHSLVIALGPGDRRHRGDRSMAPCPPRAHYFVGKTRSRNSRDVACHYKLRNASPSEETLAEGRVAVTEAVPTECQERLYQGAGFWAGLCTVRRMFLVEMGRQGGGMESPSRQAGDHQPRGCKVHRLTKGL